MKVIEKISEFFGKYMALIVLAVAALALFVPQSSLWIDTSWINYLLMVVMFGMGLTMKPRDFALVFKRPKDILVGTAAQFIIMPALAFGLSKLFQLDPALTAGVVLVGTARSAADSGDNVAAAANDRQGRCLGDVLEHYPGDYYSCCPRLCNKPFLRKIHGEGCRGFAVGFHRRDLPDYRRGCIS